MLGSWFSSKSSDNRPIDASKRTGEGILGGLHSEQQPSTDTGLDNPFSDKSHPAIAPTLTTPHDAVLAELYGHHPDLNPPSKANVSNDVLSNSPPSHDYEDLSSLNAGGSPAPDSANPAHPPADMSTHPLAEPMYDPFTGALIGMFPPGPQEPTMYDMSEVKHEEIWTRLSRVLELQSDIAMMHVQMEGLGAKTAEKLRKGKGKKEWGQHKAKGSGSAVTEDGEGEGEDEGVGVGVETDEEAEEQRAREEDFANLADKFTGRRDAIDGIMNKLDDLSQALTTFHALRTPTFNYSRSASLDTDAGSPTPTNVPKFPLRYTTTTKPSSNPFSTPGPSGFRRSPSPLPLRPELLTLDTVNAGLRPTTVESPVSMGSNSSLGD